MTRIEGKISKEDVQRALQELAGIDLPNVIEGISAQINRNQRGKLISDKARRKSWEDGFSNAEHSGAAQKIANIWKWSAEVKGIGGSKDISEDVNIHRFVSAVNVNGSDAFAWLTIKETQKGLRIYSLQLMNEKKLWEQASSIFHTPTQSFDKKLRRKMGNEIIDNYG